MKSFAKVSMSLLLIGMLSTSVFADKKEKVKNKKIISTDKQIEVIIDQVPPGQMKKYKKGPPAHAPAWGYRRKQAQKCWHFPGSDVYYREQDKQYIYLENGKWRIGHELPDWISVNYDHSVIIKDSNNRLQEILKKIGLK